MNEFDEIRPYYDEELPQVFEELIADPDFRRAVAVVLPDVPFDVWSQQMRSCRTKTEFQKTFCYGLLKHLMCQATAGTDIDCSALTDRSKAYTYLSNHRDIVLDSGFLSVLLVEQGMDTVEIAIGDNLLIHPWIKKLVRVNKSFIVQRGQSIWIAQREGRAKDSDDRTQESVLKMMAMAGEGDVVDRLMEMNVVPTAISYEYDPCDYLKAREFQLKRDCPDYRKSPADDLLNMQTGIFGYKGRVHFQVAPCINDQLALLPRTLPRSELFARVAALIDRRIHAGYRLYPGNYVAADLLAAGTPRFASRYTPEQQQQFSRYIDRQLQRIELPAKDEAFLRRKLLQMYANPLLNALASGQNPLQP